MTITAKSTYCISFSTTITLLSCCNILHSSAFHLILEFGSGGLSMNISDVGHRSLVLQFIWTSSYTPTLGNLFGPGSFSERKS